jgi:hypothetical protein
MPFATFPQNLKQQQDEEDSHRRDGGHSPHSRDDGNNYFNGHFKSILTNIMIGYKVFNQDLTCRGFQFEVGKDYKHEGKIKICSSGFHFCIKANDCFEYYPFDSTNRVCEVEAMGETQTHEEDSKVCTNHIRIIRELSWHEVLDVVNIGKNNTGRGNTGNSNTGNWNTGYSNTGDRNTGYSNTGDRNTGYRNTGNWNTGYSNTGNWNTGYRNTGDRNTGYSNTGNWNTGNWNTGDWNTGYSNTGNRNTGVFCTGEERIRLFNKQSDWTIEDFENSKAFSLLSNCVDTKQWVLSYQMSEDEKNAFPSHKTVEGYLKDIPFKEAFKNAWHNWDKENREAFTSLPNFDKDIFFQITGVEV